jgi:hypothetical protein
MTRRPPNSYRVPQAAAIINERLGTDYSLTTIRNYCREGHLRAFQPYGEGGRWYVTHAALEEFIRQFTERDSDTIDNAETEA